MLHFVLLIIARSSFFDVSTGAVDSPDPLKEASKEVTEGSCPVLAGDTEADAVRVICQLLLLSNQYIKALNQHLVRHLGM